MTSNKDVFSDTYSEFVLGEDSRAKLLKNVIAALGYQYSGPDTIQGMSGLKHKFEGVGLRGKNILLVVGGAEESPSRLGIDDDSSPRKRMETWRKSALLSAYDVQHALSHEGMLVDLMFFHNISNAPKSQKMADWEQWAQKHKLPRDLNFYHEESVSPILILSIEELVSVAQSIGASFFTLNHLSLDEISSLSHRFDKESVECAGAICDRLRLSRYFSPPGDELLLSAYDLSRSQDSGLIKAVYTAATELGHMPVRNVLVSPDIFRDPVATAKELERNKYISLESHIELGPEGQRITQTIRKTAQGSLVIRVLNAIGLPAVARAIIDAIKRI